MDRSEYSKKEFPSQTENRKQWALDVVRNNQEDVGEILIELHASNHQWALKVFNQMHKHDRDGLLIPGGILTDEQIEILGHE